MMVSGNDLYMFSMDGSYSSIDHNIFFVDTSGWSFADWDLVENATDSERAFIARGLGVVQ